MYQVSNNTYDNETRLQVMRRVCVMPVHVPSKRNAFAGSSIRVHISSPQCFLDSHAAICTWHAYLAKFGWRVDSRDCAFAVKRSVERRGRRNYSTEIILKKKLKWPTTTRLYVYCNK